MPTERRLGERLEDRLGTRPLERELRPDRATRPRRRRPRSRPPSPTRRPLACSTRSRRGGSRPRRSGTSGGRRRRCPCGVRKAEYWTLPSSRAATSLHVRRWTTSKAFGPLTRISPMCETSKRPARSRTASCSSDRPRVLDGHVPAAERNHLAAERPVPLPQRRALEDLAGDPKRERSLLRRDDKSALPAPSTDARAQRERIIPGWETGATPSSSPEAGRAARSPRETRSSTAPPRAGPGCFLSGSVELLAETPFGPHPVARLAAPALADLRAALGGSPRRRASAARAAGADAVFLPADETRALVVRPRRGRRRVPADRAREPHGGAPRDERVSRTSSSRG